MEAKTQYQDFDVLSGAFNSVELADNNERAVLTIPLMHYGPNKKGLFWTEEMLKDVTPLFQEKPFRYDLDGQEGSSHTVNKLSSPHFDVGWTYEGAKGSWYDAKTKTMWVKGEVTHPQVIEKLRRITSDGKREVNYASMGIIVEEAKCSICGDEYESCEHERMQEYEGRICYKVPTKCSKGLHAALTNDAADGEAEISNCIFQELGDHMKDKKTHGPNGSTGYEEKSKTFTSPNSSVEDDKSSDGQASPNNAQQPSNYSTDFKLQNQIPGGLAPSSPSTGQPGAAPSPQEVIQELAERLKTVENKLSENAMAEGTPELVNAAPQDQMIQDNMGGTQQFEEEQKKMPEENIGQTTQEKVPENPPKSEVQDEGMSEMGQMMAMLQEILNRLPGAEVQDLSAQTNLTKAAITHDETKPQEQKAPGDMVADDTAEGNKKNKQHMDEPGMVATADNSGSVESESMKAMKQEMADMTSKMKKLQGKLELQDNDVPEFGGTNGTPANIDVADMGAEGRAKEFGEYGKWDAAVNGAQSAEKFKRCI